MQVGLEEVTEALVVLGVDLVVPLLQPGQVLLQDGKERGQSFGGPAVLLDDFGIVSGHRLTKFKRIPAGPADEQGRVVVAAHGREADEAFLRDIQRAPQAPIGRLQEVWGAILRRWCKASNLILLATALLVLDTGCTLLLGFVFPSEGGGFDVGVDFVLTPL